MIYADKVGRQPMITNDYEFMEYYRYYDADQNREGLQLAQKSLKPKCKDVCTSDDFGYVDAACALTRFSPEKRQQLYQAITDFDGRSRLDILRELKMFLNARLASGWGQTAQLYYVKKNDANGNERWCNKNKPNGPCKEDLTVPTPPYSEVFIVDGKQLFCAPFIYCLTSNDIKDLREAEDKSLEGVRILVGEIDAIIEKESASQKKTDLEQPKKNAPKHK